MIKRLLRPHIRAIIRQYASQITTLGLALATIGLALYLLFR